MAVELANIARENGLASAVLITRRSGPLEEELHPDVPRWVLGRQHRFDLQLSAVRRITRQWQPDVLHVHGRSSMLFAASEKALGALAAPVVFHEHFGRILLDPSPARAFARLTSWAVSRVVAVSERNAAWALASGFAREKVSVIPNALGWDRLKDTKPAFLNDAIGNLSGRPAGVVVAGLRPEKGILLLLEAAARLPGERPWSILVIGGGEESPYGQACHARAVELGLQRRVGFLGPRRDAVALAKGCDFAVIPSLSESGPLVLIEHLACALPVVATQTGDLVQRAVQVGAVRTVPPGDVQALSVALAEFIQMSPARRLELGHAGQRRTEGLFDLRQVFSQWAQLYREVAATGRRQR